MSTTQDARKKFTIASAQENLYAVNVANVVCAVDTKKMGTVYNPYTSRPVVSDGAVSTSYTLNDYTADADSLQINRRADAAEHVNSYDWKSVGFGLLSDRGMNMGKGISQVIDGFTFNLPVVTSGVETLDDGDFAGTGGNPKTSSNTVIDDIINGALTELHLANTTDKKFMVGSAYEMNDLRGFLQNSGNMVMDEVIRNGIKSGVSKVGTTFSGVDVFMSNNITQVAVLGIATLPTTTDTITIAGVEITFIDALSGGDSEIHITSAVDSTAANLTEWLNAHGADAEAEGTNTGYSKGSNEDQSTLSRLGITAVATAGSDIVTVTAKGVFKVSETLADATDTWGTPYRYMVIGDYGSINLYLPTQGMDYVEKDVTLKPGKELYMEQFYNATIWTRMKKRVLAVKVN